MEKKTEDAQKERSCCCSHSGHTANSSEMQEQQAVESEDAGCRVRSLFL